MVKIDRTAFAGIIETENDYRSGPVYDLLKKYFHGKCYICEDDKPTGIQIEHRHSHKGDAQLKYDWLNLFYSCYHCNHAKLGHYDNIIDCTQIGSGRVF
jgi:5-methylcytosine-specific restriction endonuclease McrA